MEQGTDPNILQTFEEFLAVQQVDISLVGFLINLLLAGLLAYILSRLYIRYGSSLSNRKAFGRNFVLIASTTMIIITIVKSSLALSLGLVGALSIVRFRSAIKEPEELSYIFLTIAIGLGFGADQRLITIVGFGIACLYIFFQGFQRAKEENENLLLTISSNSSESQDVVFNQVLDVLKDSSKSLDLKRYDESNGSLEFSFLIEYENMNQFKQSKVRLKELDKSIRISFLDNKGMI